MSEPAQPGSSTLLLLRLVACPRDAAAWDQFVQRYSGTIYRWCCRHGLQDADARDVTQNAFAALLRSLPKFDRSRARFRTWLYRIVENCVHDWCNHPAHRQEKGTEAAQQLLDSTEARSDLEARLDEEFDLELLEVAEMQVRLKVAPQSWDAYQLRCKKQLTLREAAAQIGIPAGHVSKYALRVRDLVTRQIALLEELCAPRESSGTENRHEDLSTGGPVAEVPSGPAGPH
jgi:RNA polymerase sigma-70 factor (ECF subfamily)